MLDIILAVLICYLIYRIAGNFLGLGQKRPPSESHRNETGPKVTDTTSSSHASKEKSKTGAENHAGEYIEYEEIKKD